MYITILILPIRSRIITGILGRKIGIIGTNLISCISLIISTIFAIIAFYEVRLCNSPVSITIINWFESEIIEVSWTFIFDSLTVSILITVLIVSSLVHIYSIDYIRNDPHYQRFFAYLSIFTFFILILVTGDNYLIIFVG
jgi:NADH-ubiquinone oxidoreductase chain 5